MSEPKPRHALRPGSLTSSARGRPIAVAAISGLTLALWAGRALRAGSDLEFMLWNLFLAWVPWVAARLMAAARGRLAFAAAGAVWLLFLPNAPYLVTDLMHIAPRRGVPLWYDATLFAGFALAGCALAWASIEIIHQRLVRHLGRPGAAAAVVLVLFLTGFGVYLGRFERWNSWDVVTRPVPLLQAATAALANRRALLFSVLFGGFVGTGYVLVLRPDEEPGARAG